MITLLELRKKVKTAPLTSQKAAPGWKWLEMYGGGVEESVVLSDGTTIVVYHIGYVHYYRRDERHTTFSLQDTTLSYDYYVQEDNYGKRTVLENTIYDDFPWVIRVMLEGEYRILFNLTNSRTELYGTEYDSTYDDHGSYGYDEKDSLELILDEERSKMLYKSFCMLSEHQQQVV